MKKVEKIIMILAALTALVSVIINFKSGTYAWQLCTLLWIGTAFLKTTMIERLEKMINK